MKNAQTQTQTITHQGYHGRTTVRFRPQLTQSIEYADGSIREWHRISRRVAQRLDAAVCGMSGCRCGDRITSEVDPRGAGMWDDEEVQWVVATYGRAADQLAIA